MQPLSLRDLVIHGSSGSYKLGLGIEEFLILAGKPSDQDNGRRRKRGLAVLKYGEFEFHFGPELWLVHWEAEGCEARTDSPASAIAVVDPWIIKRGLELSQFKTVLREQSISFVTQPDEFNLGLISVVSPIGMRCLFEPDSSAIGDSAAQLVVFSLSQPGG